MEANSPCQRKNPGQKSKSLATQWRDFCKNSSLTMQHPPPSHFTQSALFSNLLFVKQGLTQMPTQQGLGFEGWHHAWICPSFCKGGLQFSMAWGTVNPALDLQEPKQFGGWAGRSEWWCFFFSQEVLCAGPRCCVKWRETVSWLKLCPVLLGVLTGLSCLPDHSPHH